MMTTKFSRVKLSVMWICFVATVVDAKGSLHQGLDDPWEIPSYGQLYFARALKCESDLWIKLHGDEVSFLLAAKRTIVSSRFNREDYVCGAFFCCLGPKSPCCHAPPRLVVPFESMASRVPSVTVTPLPKPSVDMGKLKRPADQNDRPTDSLKRARGLKESFKDVSIVRAESLTSDHEESSSEESREPAGNSAIRLIKTMHTDAPKIDINPMVTERLVTLLILAQELDRGVSFARHQCKAFINDEETWKTYWQHLRKFQKRKKMPCDLDAETHKKFLNLALNAKLKWGVRDYEDLIEELRCQGVKTFKRSLVDAALNLKGKLPGVTGDSLNYMVRQLRIREIPLEEGLYADFDAWEKSRSARSFDWDGTLYCHEDL